MPGRSFVQLLDQNPGVPPALVVLFTTHRRKIIQGALHKAALQLEISKRLSRERDQFREAHFAGFVFNEAHQLSTDALVSVRRIDIKAGEFALLLPGIDV